MKRILKHIFSRFFQYIYAVALPESFSEYLKNQQKRHTELEWRKVNPHNFTKVGNEIFEMPFPLEKVLVGNYSYGALKVFSFSTTDEMLKIGSFCSIAPNVKFILGGRHHLNHFSTYPFKANLQKINESVSKGSIIVEDDVWIGTDTVILSGITIAKGTVIGAGSVITKSTLPYSIVGGNPASLIRYRFSEDLIDKLMQINMSSLTSDFIINNIELFYENLNSNIVEFLIKETNK
jgi:virginiamycin A acetyltransferase